MEHEDGWFGQMREEREKLHCKSVDTLALYLKH